MILQGDCIKEMQKLEANSVDTIITDPPAGIAFMGKDWDKDKGGRDEWIKWFSDVMRECYRVAKPGSTALVWAIPRTSHWTATAIENAGWQIKDIIMHIFGSGFPKATDISKQLDKGHKREVVGKRKKEGGRTGKNPYQSEDNNFNGGNDNLDITEPSTPEAKLWNGWKSHGLKPAAEHWIVAVKPNEGSYAQNALKHGVSGLNIDGGRIGYQSEKDKKEGQSARKTTSKGQFATQLKDDKYNRSERETIKGRFPANLILDEEAGKMLDEQSGSKCGQLAPTTGKEPSASKKNQIYGDYSMVDGKPSQPKDNLGGASRFFYCAKSSKSERNAGCEELEEKKVSDGRQKEADNAYQKGKTLRVNTHPCVKPISLMEYLCTLTKTPTGGVVLDPFAGSGTTGLACQNTGRDYILIEREAEYVKIIEARIKGNKKRLKDLNRQQTLI